MGMPRPASVCASLETQPRGDSSTTDGGGDSGTRGDLGGEGGGALVGGTDGAGSGLERDCFVAERVLREIRDADVRDVALDTDVFVALAELGVQNRARAAERRAGRARPRGRGGPRGHGTGRKPGDGARQVHLLVK